MTKDVVKNSNEDELQQEEVNKKMKAITEGVYNFINELQSDPYYRNFDIDFSQIASSMEETYKDAFSRLVNEDGFSLDAALSETMAALDVGSMTLKSNPEAVVKNYNNKSYNEVINKMATEYLSSRIEANKDVINRPEPKSAAPMDKEQFLGNKFAVNSALMQSLMNLFKGADIETVSNFYDSNATTAEGKEKNMYLAQLQSTLAFIPDKPFEELKDINRYTILDIFSTLKIIAQEDPEFDKVIDQIIISEKDKLPPDLIDEEGKVDFHKLVKYTRDYHKIAYDFGMVPSPTYDPMQRKANFITAAVEIFGDNNMYLSLADMAYERIATSQLFEMSHEYAVLASGSTTEKQLDEFVESISDEKHIPGFLDFVSGLQVDEAVQKRQYGQCIETDENGYAIRNELDCKFKDKVDHKFFAMYREQQEIDEREDRQGIDRFVDGYTNEKYRIAIRHRIIRDVITKGKVEPEVLDEMLATDPALVRMALVDILRDGIDIPREYGISFDISLGNIVSYKDQLDKIMGSGTIEMENAIEQFREDGTPEKDKEFLAQVIQETKLEDLGKEADYRDRKQKIEEIVDEEKNYHEYEALQSGYLDLVRANDRVGLMKYAEEHREEITELRRRLPMFVYDEKKLSAMSKFYSTMENYFSAIDVIDSSEKFINSQGKYSSPRDKFRGVVNNSPDTAAILYILADAEEFKDDPRFNGIREERDATLRTIHSVIRSDPNTTDRQSVLRQYAINNSGATKAITAYIVDAVNDNKPQTVGIKDHEEFELVTDAYIYALKQEKEKSISEKNLATLNGFYEEVQLGRTTFDDYLEEIISFGRADVDRHLDQRRERTKSEGKVPRMEREEIALKAVHAIYIGPEESKQMGDYLKGFDREDVLDALSVVFAKPSIIVPRLEKSGFLEMLSEYDSTMLPDIQKKLVDRMNSSQNKNQIMHSITTIKGIEDKRKDEMTEERDESTDSRSFLNGEKTDLSQLGDKLGGKRNDSGSER